MIIRMDDENVLQARREKWHQWFAWHPARINQYELVWLEMVERKYGGPMYEGCIWYEYRRIEANRTS